MQKTLLVLTAIIAIVSSTCISTNQTVDPTDIQRSLPSLKYGSTNFALEMFRALHSDPTTADNVFFSPVSVWTALVTVFEGARQQTAKELASVLGVGDVSPAVVPAALDAFLRSCSGCDEGRKSILNIATRIYFQKDLEFQLCNPYLQKILQKIDFKTDPEKARTTINDFVENETKGKIQDLIPPNSVDSLTQMIIANAVYFKGTWKNQFPVSMTKPLRFYPSQGSPLEVPMMNTMGTFFYGVSNEMDCQALELPYNDDRTSMLILLPRHPYRGLDTLAATIGPKRLESLLDAMTPREVLVTLPKYKVEQQYELSKPLKKMGLRNLFDPVFSDLTGFTGGERMNVDAIHHKSYIKVNEEGTEAAAATALVISRAAMQDPRITRFFADRPFLYLIRDNYSGNVLFVGTIRSPKYSED